MRARTLVASLLLATILAIALPIASLPPFDAAEEDAIPPPALAAVRECLAAIDQFILDGDTETLWQTLDVLGHGLDPWPQSSRTERDTIALAFRATFPGFHLTLTDIDRMDESYAAELAITGTGPSLPAWLGPGESPMIVQNRVFFDVDERGSITGSGTGLLPGPLARSLPIPISASPLDGPSRLIGVHLTLTPSAHGRRYLAVPGPSVVIPESEALQVDGEGRRLVFDRNHPRGRSSIADESIAIEPGDLLYIQDGYVVLTMTGDDPATLFYAGAIPKNPEQVIESEGGRENPPSFSTMIASGPVPTTTWFGSIDSAVRDEVDIPAGVIALSLTWVVLPPGEALDIESGTRRTIALEPWSDSASAGTPSPVFDRSDNARLLLVIRANSA